MIFTALKSAIMKESGNRIIIHSETKKKSNCDWNTEH